MLFIKSSPIYISVVFTHAGGSLIERMIAIHFLTRCVACLTLIIKTSKILEGIIIRNRHKIFRGMNEYSEDDSPYVAAIDLAKELTGKNLTILKIVLLIIVFCWVVNCCLNSQL